ncbi:derepression protein [Salmonella enterica subsp. enterica serovar Muenchen]|nr:derepression protein [Salmonella enterica]ECB0372820.1 derepression protein [Salmonella enterica subsp. enterica serovar Muenchen]ECH9523160.1 derepression protein [Salmonella enterica subsp. enterica]EDK0477173.1 derepression protein [Salmonella enterica]EDO5599022.1 derepression protein [Salmonella enterica]
MASRKQRRAQATRIHTQTEINRRLFRARQISAVMRINMLSDDAYTISPLYIAAVFSYLADDLRDIKKLVGTPGK